MELIVVIAAFQVKATSALQSDSACTLKLSVQPKQTFNFRQPISTHSCDSYRGTASSETGSRDEEPFTQATRRLRLPHLLTQSVTLLRRGDGVARLHDTHFTTLRKTLSTDLSPFGAPLNPEGEQRAERLQVCDRSTLRYF